MITDEIDGVCPQCGPNRRADVIACHRASDGNEDFWYDENYRILRCRGCGTPYFQKQSVSSESPLKTEIDYESGFLEEEPIPALEYWPQYQVRTAPAWLWQMHPDDPVLDEVLRELYLALQGHLDVLAAIAVRTAFDIAMELLGIGSGLRFVQKLDQLQTDGRIAKDEKEILSRLVDAGNSAAHRGWRPTRDELDTMIDILEGFLNRAFILNAKSAKLAKGLPAKGSPAVGGPRRRTK